MGAEKQLRRSVPKRDHPVRKGFGVFKSARSGKPKICQLQNAVIVNEQVGTFYVAVENVIQMTVVQTSQQLMHVAPEEHNRDQMGIMRGIGNLDNS